MRDTSLEAFDEIRPFLGKMQYNVLVFMAQIDRPVCNIEIASGMGRPINTITPRVKELRDKLFVREYKKQTGPNGRTVWYWQLEPELPSPASLYFGEIR